MGILIVNPDLPPLDRDSGSLRLRRLIELLLEDGHRVTLLALAGFGQEKQTAALAALGVAVYPVDRSRLQAAGAAVGGPPLALDQLLAEGSFEVALLCRYELAAIYLPLLRARAPHLKIAIDTVDLHFLREQRAAALSGDPAALRRAKQRALTELATYRQADALVAISDQERKLIEALVPAVPVHVVSNIHPPVGPTPPFGDRGGLIFVGNFPHAPNVDGILYFYREVWPLVRARLPEAELVVVGNEPPPSVRALEGDGVRVLGRVADLAPLLDRARVSIAPLRYGAGVKGKVGEALARGLPVVTTAIGAEGMALRAGRDLLIADDPASFAAAVVELYTNRPLWERLSQSGRQQIQATLGPQRAQAALRGLLAELSPGVRARPRRRRLAQLGAVIAHAVDDPRALRAQLAALANASRGRSLEVVVVADPLSPAAERELAGAQGATVVRASKPLGRYSAWQLGAEAAHAPRAVALGPLCLPEPDALGALLEALAGPSMVVGPSVEGTAGLTVDGEGLLQPRRDRDQPLDALALDCLAAQTALFAGGLPTPRYGDGYAELALAKAVGGAAALAVEPRAAVRRLAPLPATVVICTRNRADLIGRTVHSVLAQGAAEVVVVDNGSTDGTWTALEELAAKCGGRLRAVAEPEPGLSQARNSGAQAASHDLLLYLDDDAVPTPGWLAYLSNGLGREGVVNAGGPIAALWPANRPPGYPGRALEPLFSILDLGDAEREALPPDAPLYGGNWAVRRGALAAAGWFDRGLGYAPGRRLGGEEVAVAARLVELGLGRLLYLPGAAVVHPIPAARIGDRFPTERVFAVGVEQTFALRAKGSQPLLAVARESALALLALPSLRGDLELARAHALIVGAPLELAARVALCHQLGRLAAAAVLLGEREVEVGPLRLTVDPEAVLEGRLGATLAEPSARAA